MAAKIGVTGHAIVDPYVEPQYSGWDGTGFTNRHYETLHKVIYFDLIANRGIPAFSLTLDGGYSPGSIHSAGKLHAFMNEVAPVISQREYLADIGLASSSWSQIAAQPPFGGWNHEVTKRHARRVSRLGAISLFRARLPAVGCRPVRRCAPPGSRSASSSSSCPSVLVITADQLAVLEGYLKQGGKLLVTGETGTFTGPQMLLLPRPQPLAAVLAQKFPQQVVVTTEKPGLQQHLDPAKSFVATNWRLKAFPDKPVLTVASAPEHVIVQISESKARPGEFTLDLVNYHHDLASDTLTPVTADRFRSPLASPGPQNRAASRVHPLRRIRAAQHPLRTAAQLESITRRDGTLTLGVPSFTHYQILRITTP